MSLAYNIDTAHSAAQFKVRHMMIANVKGEFTKVSGSVVIDAENPSASSVEATIDVNTISTRETDRDNHLKSADFFDVATYPTITFKSKSVVPMGDTDFEVTGDLTIHGSTNQVALIVEDLTPEIKDPWGLQRRGATAKTKISRKEFGLTWNAVLEAGGIAVGDEVDITIDIEMVRQAAAGA